MYCFRIENAYTQSGLIANPTERKCEFLSLEFLSFGTLICVGKRKNIISDGPRIYYIKISANPFYQIHPRSNSIVSCSENMFLCPLIALCRNQGKQIGQTRRSALQLNFLFLKLFLDCHFVNEVLAVAELFEDEQHIADVESDATLKVVVEIDVTTQ